jgi:hypothetical protein
MALITWEWHSTFCRLLFIVSHSPARLPLLHVETTVSLFEMVRLDLEDVVLTSTYPFDEGGFCLTSLFALPGRSTRDRSWTNCDMWRPFNL